ncbi:MAG: carboxypeptidase-like regulatory domain-containing protein [Cytophagaceae bacterium]|nr:carboxypeptidase-like regulatory domain-containing protein [Cytophagaceae bacterium]
MSFHSFAQSDSLKRHDPFKRVIQLSGLVVAGDSSYGVPGVSVYVPKAGRGAITSSVGYFSFPVLSGDSVVIKSLGYKEKHFVVPVQEEDKLSVIIQLMEDTLLLPVVEIFPYPTEKLFKEAFLALKLPEQDLDNMHKNLNEQVMKRMLYNVDQDGSMNHKYYMQQQVVKTENRMMYPTINFLNPFAWSKFIQSVKKGELKNKASDYYYEDDED